MNKHENLRRVAPPGVNLWQCVRCGREGELKPLLTTECTAEPMSKEEKDKALLTAIRGDA